MGQRFDEPLNEAGLKQAEVVADKLLEQEFDIIFSSPLRRAVQTAEAIAKGRSIQVVLRGELRERDWGSLSGKTWEEMDAEIGVEPGYLANKDFNQEYDYRAHGGESAQDVKERFLRFIDHLKTDHANKRVMVIAHGGILRLSNFLFNQEKLKHITNTAIVECEI